ncbi:MAG TPA: hypothetical protein VGQ76_08725 [Thermoanaerobaculia bacterium]|nr:hypothetical protein [Thermoanaerobaculia bacterium]
MRKGLLALSLVLAPTLFAQTADLDITSAGFSITPTATSQRTAINIRWKNNGPDPAHFVNVTVTGVPTPYFLIWQATTPWTCYPNPQGETFRCQNGEILTVGDVGLVVQMLTPPTPGAWVVRVAISAAEQDPNLANNEVLLAADLAAAPATDLSMSPESQVHREANDSEVSIPFIVANNGDNPVNNGIAVFTLPVLDTIPPMTASGEGWACDHPPYGPQAIDCRRTSPLAPGAIAPITLTTTAPSIAGSFTIHGRVAGEGFSDPIPSNNHVTAEVTSIAPVLTWSKLLLPLVGPDLNGANGSLWRTEITAMRDYEFEIQPCGLTSTCTLMPIGVPFNAQPILAGSTPGLGQFVLVRPENETRLFFNARVYDVSRETETAGSEIPIVREHDFTSGPMSIIGIPVASEYRHTLRIYDLDAHDGGQVAIRFYADSETTPRVSLTRSLFVPQPPLQWSDGTALQPGTIQLDVGSLLSLTGVNTLRVDVEPLDADLRLWSFVSVTNNETHHVTTFSAK